MARSIQEIFEEIEAAKNANAVLASSLTSTSNVAIWRLWAYVVATAIWTLEKLFDAHIVEVNALFERDKPHTKKWYVEKVKAFRLGMSLSGDTDEYPVLGREDTQLIVSEAAVVERYNGLLIKTAKRQGGQIVPHSILEKQAIAEYVAQIKDAGVRVAIQSSAGDQIQIYGIIYYNPLVLNALGERLDGMDNAPVVNAVTKYLEQMQFDSRLIKQHLIDVIQRVEGVVTVETGFIYAAPSHFVGLLQQLPPIYETYSGYFGNISASFNYQAV
jgi:hypothetical protein